LYNKTIGQFIRGELQRTVFSLVKVDSVLQIRRNCYWCI